MTVLQSQGAHGVTRMSDINSVGAGILESAPGSWTDSGTAVLPV
jgi:hypothetical protein